MSTENKLVKTVTDASVLIGLSAGVSWVARKVLKEPFTSDPSSNVMNFGKWVAVMTGSIYLKDYLTERLGLDEAQLKGFIVQHKKRNDNAKKN